MRRQPKLLASHPIQMEDRMVPAIVNFTLTSASSTLTLSGTVDGNAISEQKTGSLTANYTGKIQVDVDYVNNTIQFIGAGTSASALNFSQNLTPAVGGGSGLVPGSAPANYGGKATITLLTTLAARNMVATFDSGILALTGTGTTRTFPSTQQVLITNGTVDYNNFLLQGSDSLIGQGGTNAAGDGTITDNGNGSYSLIMPGNATINDTVNGLPLILNIAGAMNGTAVLPVVDLNGAGSGFDSKFSHAAGTAPTKIAPLATIAEVGSPNLTAMTVKLTAAPDGVAESLAVDLTGLTGLATTGYDSITGELVITGPANIASFQSALQRVTYADSSPMATAGLRNVLVSVSDGTNSSFPRTALGTVVVPPAQVQSVVVNDGSVQRSQVKSLTVTFDRTINPDPTVSAFQLQRKDNTPVNLSLVVDNSGPTTKAVLTFTGGAVNGTSLADGRYNLTIDGTQINGGNFDGGGGIGSSYVVMGDPAVAPKLYRFFGDADGNNQVNSLDFALFRSAFGITGPSIFDFDDSNSVGGPDFAQFRARFGTSV